MPIEPARPGVNCRSTVSTSFPCLAQNSFASSLTLEAAEAETPPPIFAVFFEIINLSSASGTTPELAQPASNSVRKTMMYFKICTSEVNDGGDLEPLGHPSSKNSTSTYHPRWPHQPLVSRNEHVVRTSDQANWRRYGATRLFRTSASESGESGTPMIYRKFPTVRRGSLGIG